MKQKLLIFLNIVFLILGVVFLALTFLRLDERNTYLTIALFFITFANIITFLRNKNGKTDK